MRYVVPMIVYLSETHSCIEPFLVARVSCRNSFLKSNSSTGLSARIILVSSVILLGPQYILCESSNTSVKDIRCALPNGLIAEASQVQSTMRLGLFTMME